MTTKHLHESMQQYHRFAGRLAPMPDATPYSHPWGTTEVRSMVWETHDKGATIGYEGEGHWYVEFADTTDPTTYNAECLSWREAWVMATTGEWEDTRR